MGHHPLLLLSLLSGCSGSAPTVIPPAEVPDTGIDVESVPGTESEALPHPIFRSDLVHEWSLSLSDESWDALIEDPYSYVKATFDAGLGPVTIGVRLKGWSSFRPLTDKPSLKFDFDRFVDGGRFHGLEHIDMASEIHDLAAVSEFIAYRLFRDNGLPAPRTGFAQLTINDQAYGFYTVVEARDDEFIEHRWADDKGSLYESSSEHWPCDLDDPGCDCFELDEAGKNDNRDDLALFCSVATDTPDDAWLASMKEVMDWTVFQRSMAMEMALGTYDHYAGYRGNYYLYHEPQADLWWFSPSSMNVQFGAVKGTSAACGTDVKAIQDYDGGLLVRRCWDIEACAGELEGALAWVVAALGGSDIGAVISEVEALVEPYVAADPKREFTVSQFHDQLSCIRDWLAERPGELGKELPEPCLGTDGELVIETRGTLDTNHSCDRSEPDAVAYAIVSWSGSTVVVGESAEGLAGGDEVLIWIAGSALSAPDRVGQMVSTKVLGAAGDTVTLDADIEGALGALDSARAVLQRVPHYSAVTVSPGATLTVSPWNGETGGLLALRVSGTLLVHPEGQITVDGLGFAGGPTATAFNRDGFQGESWTGLGGGGVSSTLGYNEDEQWWRPNAGGGGANITGGGGAHAGGATAGDSWDEVATPPQPGELYGVADLSRITLGSGGGAVANIYDSPGPGGSGGGVLWLRADTIIALGTQALTAKGQDATAWTSGTWSYGAGGGAGGSLILEADELELGSDAVSATGGIGVNHTIRVGGDGGTGRIRVACSQVNSEPCSLEALEGLVSPAPYLAEAP
jgi:hypothetical protein